MLILVAVTITIAVNGGLFKQAGRASKETHNAIDAEQKLANGGITIGNIYYNSINDYLYGPKLKYKVEGNQIVVWLENSEYDFEQRRNYRL